MNNINILLINPYIHDFALYDLWVRPHGLLKAASVLERQGCEIDLINCLDRKDPDIATYYKRNTPRFDEYDCGKFPKTQIEKPQEIENVSRRYYRYGIPVELFRKKLAQATKPDAIILTSIMTYWYPGVVETIKITKEQFPDTPVILGGIYPIICPEHARKHTGADYILKNPQLNHLINIINAIVDHSFDKSKCVEDIIPAYHLLKNNNAAALQTSVGCPFSCTYCASKLIEPHFIQRDHDSIIKELTHYHDLGIENIAFYDDAVLYKAESHFIPLMKKILENNLHFYFHTPNALHARYITPEVASLIKLLDFRTIRLGIETTIPEKQKDTGDKVTNTEIEQALTNLNNNGFTSREIEMYLLVGLPGQTVDDVKRDIAFIHNLGAHILLASYSSIPGTIEWTRAVKNGFISEDLDPLWHNHTICPSINPAFSIEIIRELRHETKRLNNELN
ncbi:MAG: radical SAM protein [Candidatus Ancaeobacter aquaticus]|nr:radical SAM protein [Candidatus Ancaeobacter aquaticus]